jgi:hypothetical protein
VYVCAVGVGGGGGVVAENLMGLSQSNTFTAALTGQPGFNLNFYT